jgi:hypothetical protein
MCTKCWPLLLATLATSLLLHCFRLFIPTIYAPFQLVFSSFISASLTRNAGLNLLAGCSLHGKENTSYTLALFKKNFVD